MELIVQKLDCRQDQLILEGCSSAEEMAVPLFLKAGHGLHPLCFREEGRAFSVRIPLDGACCVSFRIVGAGGEAIPPAMLVPGPEFPIGGLRHGYVQIGAHLLERTGEGLAVKPCTAPRRLRIFWNCTNLSSVVIPNSMTKISSGTFLQCTSLTSITLPNSITHIGSYAFSDCTGLTSITLPNSVTTIDDFAFQGCKNLSSITIPSGVTTIAVSTFNGCSALKSIIIPSNVATIEDNAFLNCVSLTSVTIPSSVTSIGDGVLNGCPSLTTINVKNKSYAHQWCIENGYEDKVQFY